MAARLFRVARHDDARQTAWVRVVAGPFLVYLIVCAVVDFATYEGRLRVKDGRYALTSHGRVVREVSEPEFRDAERWEVRGVTGHWMAFSAVPAVYFLVVYPRARRALAAPPAPAEAQLA